MCVKFTTPNKINCIPYDSYAINTLDGVKTLIWGDKILKNIHKRVEDLGNRSLNKGTIQITGFYVWRKEKVIAPIGFGDHKESLKLHELLVTRNELANVPVLYDNEHFYVLVSNASPAIVSYQPNEPFHVEDVNNWLMNGDVSTFKPFTDSEYYIQNI